MKHFSMNVLAVIASTTIGTFANAQTDPPLTLMHWWISDAESSALQVIVDEAQARGLNVELLSTDDHRELREKISDMLRVGHPPDFSQWIASGDLKALVRSTETAVEWPEISDRINPVLREMLTVDGVVSAIPIVTHAQNTMFVNTALLTKYRLAIPETWDEFTSAIQVLSQAGVQPVITSSEAWQLRMLFNNILLGVGGVDTYLSFYRIENNDNLHDAIEKSFEVFLNIRSVQSENQPQYWADVAHRFAQDDIGFFFLGDFAWAELASAPGVNLVNFDCLAAPETEDVLVFGTDILLSFGEGDANRRELQRAFGDVILDPQVQADFVAIKGGMPVITDIDPEQLAPCARDATLRWRREGTHVMPTPWSFNRVAMNYLEANLDVIWSDESINASEAADMLLKLFETPCSKFFSRREKLGTVFSW